jgi:hypothetical protein
MSSYDNFDFNRTLPLISEDTEFFPLMSQEDEEEMNKEPFVYVWEGSDYQSLKGKATVVGISSTSALGNQYILQTDQIISEEYPYTTFVCPECYIKYHS